MKKAAFIDNWTFRRIGTEEWQSIDLPHDAMLSEQRLSTTPAGHNTGWFEGKDYEYRKTFTIPIEKREKEIFFEFEGVYRLAEVLINGQKVLFHPYGYTGFFIKATEYLKYGAENEIRVIARNADQPNSRWYSGAGIYRPVYCYTGEKKCILPEGVKIRTIGLEPVKVEIRVSTNAAGHVTSNIYDGNTCVATVSGESEGEVILVAAIDRAVLWGVDTPHLYRLEVEYANDRETIDFGIRTISCDKNGFCLNGKRTLLLGACVHHDNGLLGACAYSEAEERKIRILKEQGFNAIRSAHNPCSKAMLKACDRLGMLVMDEYTDMWYTHKTKYDYAEYVLQYWKQDLKAIVDKDYNHPSVVMYSIGNEVSETAQKKGIRLTGEMTEYLHTLDYRPVTCGVNIFFNFLSSVGFGVYSDKKSQKQDEEMKEKAIGSEFFNQLAGMLGDETMKIGATLPPCDWKTKDAFARLDVAGYNYGIRRYKHDLKKYPDRLIVGSETFCKDTGKFWELAKQNPRLIGDFVWTGFDYLGEVGLGAWEYADYAKDFAHTKDWLAAGSGRIDLTGKPQGEAAYMRTVYRQEKIPAIAVVPVNHTQDSHSPSAWRMSNALESWSWSGCEGNPARVEVYSCAHSVELSINGKAAAEKKLKHCRAVFDTTYYAGELKAVAYDASHREVGYSVLRSASEEEELQILPESAAAAGKLLFVRLRYTDGQGIWKPLMRGRILVNVQGGELVAIGHGCPYNQEGYLGNSTDTYYGEALAIVRADARVSEMILTATDGRYDASAKIMVKDG